MNIADLLDGLLPPITTPFDESGNLDLKALEQNIELYNEHPLRGYVAFGSNGEAAHLDLHEQRRVLETVKRRAAPGRTLIAGIHQQSTRGAIAAVRQAAQAGADLALVITPYFYRGAMTEAALETFFRAVAEASELPILVYSIPQNTGVTVSAISLARLSEHPNIVGVKDSSGNLGALAKTLEQVPPTFNVLVGNAGIYLPALQFGARGAILALACVAPTPCVELFTALRSGDDARALELQKRLAPLGRAVTADFGIPGLKAAVEMVGFAGGPPRGPLLPLGQKDRNILRQTLIESDFFDL